MSLSLVVRSFSVYFCRANRGIRIKNGEEEKADTICTRIIMDVAKLQWICAALAETIVEKGINHHLVISKVSFIVNMLGIKHIDCRLCLDSIFPSSNESTRTIISPLAADRISARCLPPSVSLRVASASAVVVGSPARLSLLAFCCQLLLPFLPPSRCLACCLPALLAAFAAVSYTNGLRV